MGWSDLLQILRIPAVVSFAVPCLICIHQKSTTKKKKTNLWNGMKKPLALGPRSRGCLCNKVILDTATLANTANYAKSEFVWQRFYFRGDDPRRYGFFRCRVFPIEASAKLHRLKTTPASAPSQPQPTWHQLILRLLASWILFSLAHVQYNVPHIRTKRRWQTRGVHFPLLLRTHTWRISKNR